MLIKLKKVIYSKLFSKCKRSKAPGFKRGRAQPTKRSAPNWTSLALAGLGQLLREAKSPLLRRVAKGASRKVDVAAT